jgi:hypothetical protein
MAQGRANKKAKKVQGATVVSVIEIKTLNIDTIAQSSQPGISSQLNMVCLSIIFNG